MLELPAVIEALGDPPDDIGTGHHIRDVTESVARDQAAWTPELAASIGAFFDEVAPRWGNERNERAEVLADALDRGLVPMLTSPAPVGPVLELGAGTGAGTRELATRFDDVVAGDLASEMLVRLPATLASRVRLDASALPIGGGTVAVVVLVNMMLFPDELRRVLRPDGTVVWVNSIGERTPIHLSAAAVAEALGDGFQVTASRAGWGTWAVATRQS